MADGALVQADSAVEFQVISDLRDPDMAIVFAETNEVFASQNVPTSTNVTQPNEEPVKAQVGRAIVDGTAVEAVCEVCPSDDVEPIGQFIACR